MADTDKKKQDDRMLREYDFSNGIRGKYASRFTTANVVLLDADIAEDYPDSKAVNDALRLLANLARRQSRPSRRK